MRSVVKKYLRRGDLDGCGKVKNFPKRTRKVINKPNALVRCKLQGILAFPAGAIAGPAGAIAGHAGSILGSVVSPRMTMYGTNKGNSLGGPKGKVPINREITVIPSTTTYVATTKHACGESSVRLPGSKTSSKSKSRSRYKMLDKCAHLLSSLKAEHPKSSDDKKNSTKKDCLKSEEEIINKIWPVFIPNDESECRKLAREFLNQVKEMREGSQITDLVMILVRKGLVSKDSGIKMKKRGWSKLGQYLQKYYRKSRSQWNREVEFKPFSDEY